MIKNRYALLLLLLQSYNILSAADTKESDPLLKTQQNLEHCLGILTSNSTLELNDDHRSQLRKMITSTNPLLPTITPTEPSTGSDDAKLVQKALEATKKRAQAMQKLASK